MRIRKPRLLVGALLAVAVSACGTTVSGTAATQAGTVAGTTSGDSLSVPSAGATVGGSTAGGSGGVTAPGGTGTRPTGTATSTTPGGSTGISGSTTSGQPQQNGIGITPTKIYVGVTYAADGEAANRAAGVNLSSGDEKADAQAVIDDVNAHGGVAGRKLVPVFYAYDLESQQTDAQQDQEACAAFTQDNKVFAVAGDGLSGNPNVLRQCLLKAGVLLVSAGTLTTDDRATLAQTPNFFNMDAPVQERWMSAMISAQLRQGYFRGWDTRLHKPGAAKPVIGILAYDDPNWDDPLKNVVLPRLRAAGYTVNPDNIAHIMVPHNEAEQAPAIAQVQNAALKFRGNGVTHVISLDTTGGLTFLFARTAQGQGYYPRFGVGSGSGMQGLYDAGDYDNNSLAGAMGVGWAPSIDLPAADGDKYATSVTRHCLAVMKKRTGQTFTSTNAAGIALSYCDSIYLIARSASDAGAAINLSSARAAIERLRGTWQDASLPRVYFSPQQHDGTELGWDMYWDTSCKCARYTGSPRPLN